VVHLDDLAVSVGHELGDRLPREAVQVALDVLVAVAVRRAGDFGGLLMVRSLARRERQPGALRAL
jgi:hypothetical protein